MPGPRRASAGRPARGPSRALALAALLAGCSRPLAPPARASELGGALWSEVRARVERGDLARGDGWIYAVDVGQLLLCAALADERDAYARLARVAREELVHDDPG